MATYFSSDIDFVSLQNSVLRELHEPVGVGSEAVPLDLVKDKINEVYAEAFTDTRMKQHARENDVTFNLSLDTTLDGASSAGDTTLDLEAATTWQDAGKFLLADDIGAYTGKSSNQLTGVTGLDVDHADGAVIRQLYDLNELTGDEIDSEQIQMITINGIPQTYVSYEMLFNQTHQFVNRFTVYKGHLLFGRFPSATTVSSTTSNVLMTYTQKVAVLSGNTDKPSLIQNQWRNGILVYGACMKIAASDAFRTSWDYWKSEYEKALTSYIQFRNNRVQDKNNKSRPSVYDHLLRF